MEDIFSKEVFSQSEGLPCPICEYVTDITLDEIYREIIYLCAGCKTQIKLFDQDFSARATDQALKRLEKSLNETINEINRSGFIKMKLSRK